MKTRAYLYIWSEISTNKWYIGSKTSKGCFPGDGYICSSYYVKPIILENPENWKQTILCIGDQHYIRELEYKYLITLDAKHNPLSYNQHNGDGKFSRIGISPWNKGKTGIYSAEAIAHLSAINTGKKQSAETIIKKTASQTGATRSNEAKQNMSNAQVGRIISVTARKKLSLCNTGKTMSAETKAKISATAKLKREERKTK
jgi:NUMOD3 motif